MKTIDKNISILEHEFSDEFENSQRSKYLVINLRGEEYAIEIKYIAEIVEPGKTVFIQNPAGEPGLFIKLKNKAIHATNLRKLFNISETEIKDNTAIILTVNGAQKALIVDSVMDLEDIDIENSEKSAIAASRPGADHIKTACLANGEIKKILDIEKIFSN